MNFIGNSLATFSTIIGERKTFSRSLSMMNNENKLNPSNNGNISIRQGNYNERIEGDYIGNVEKYYSAPKPIDNITGIPSNLTLTESKIFFV